jgi:HAE1 family hydrophobic/amphiphilic exporter-1
MSGHDAAIRAMDELFGPVVGITLVLMSVFLPTAFMPGLTGKMFAQFALVIAVTALISAINAATLKPTQCALWLREMTPLDQRNFFYRDFNAVYQRMEKAYATLIGGMVRRSGLMVVIALAVAGAALRGIARLPTAFIPIDDQGYAMIAVQGLCDDRRPIAGRRRARADHRGAGTGDGDRQGDPWGQECHRDIWNVGSRL